MFAPLRGVGDRFEADPEVWRKGGREVGRARVACKEDDGAGARVAVSPDGSMLVGARSAASDKVVTIYEPADASVVTVLEGPSAKVNCVAVDGTHIACGCWDGRIFVSTAEGELLGEMAEKHGNRVCGVVLLGDLLVSCSFDMTAKLWSVSARTCSATLTEHTDEVWCVAVTDEAIATGSDDKSVRIWRVGGRACLRTLPHSGAVRGVALADDVLVTGCRDKVVRTFSVSTGVQTRTLEGHTDRVCAVALSGSMVVSGGEDKVVKVWALTGEASAECVATLEGHTNWVMGVAVGPDFVASQAYDDSEMIVWRAA
jgi:WD40 repeat protein